MAWPCITTLTEMFRDDYMVYLAASNREVASIMKWPDGLWDILASEPQFAYSQADVIVLGAGAAINYKFTPQVLHLSQMFYLWAGLEAPELCPEPELIDIPPSEQQYDYLIAPWSKDDNRAMTKAEAEALLNSLDGSVGILGGPMDPMPWEEACGVRYIYGSHLKDVVALLKACKKAVITTDSAVSRIAHAAKIKNHVLLAKPIITPLQWQSHPRCIVVQARPDGAFGSWRLSDIFEGLAVAESA